MSIASYTGLYELVCFFTAGNFAHPELKHLQWAGILPSTHNPLSFLPHTSVAHWPKLVYTLKLKFSY